MNSLWLIGRAMILTAMLTLMSAATPVRAESKELIRRSSDRFEFQYQFTLPTIEANGRVWMPLGKSDEFQTVNIAKLAIPTQWKLVQDEVHKNWVVTFMATPEMSGKMVTVNYEVTRQEKSAFADDSDNVNLHLLPERLVPADKRFRQIAGRICQNYKNSMDRGRALYQHTLKRMSYAKTGKGWGRGDAIYACDARTGNCTDFHAYFIALCRAVNIPARFAIGFTIPADSDEGEIGGYHCWAEFYAEGKWVPVDISEAEKHPELADYYFGHHPANRFELTVGRDLKLTPALATGPANYLVYPLVEVDSKLLRPEFQFRFKRID